MSPAFPLGLVMGSVSRMFEDESMETRVPGGETLAALGRLGERLGEDLLGQVAASFLSQGREWLAAMREALAVGHCGALTSAAHSLCGAAAVLRAGDLERCSAQLQALARQGELVAARALLPAVVLFAR